VLVAVLFATSHILSLVRGEHVVNVISDIRTVLYVMFIVVFLGSNRNRLIKLLKLFVILTVVSVIFGMLVYFVGEPFASIRYWLGKSQSYNWDIFVGKGTQLSGMYCPPHIFGYMMGVVPVLCFAL